MLLEHLDVWKAVSPTPFPFFYHNRNFKGGNALRYCYGNIQRMGAKAGPDGVVRLRQPTPTTITFMVDEREAPTEDQGERPPKMKKIRSLAEEEKDTESEEELLLTKRKRKEVSAQKGQDEPFKAFIGNWRAGRKDRQRRGNGIRGPPRLRQVWRPAEREVARARSSSLPAEELLEPDIPLSEQVLEPRARRPARAILPSAGLGGLDTSQLDPEKLKEGVLGKSQRGPQMQQEGGLGERPQGTKMVRRQC
jgi:hypothetical protein